MTDNQKYIAIKTDLYFLEAARSIALLQQRELPSPLQPLFKETLDFFAQTENIVFNDIEDRDEYVDEHLFLLDGANILYEALLSTDSYLRHILRKVGNKINEKALSASKDDVTKEQFLDMLEFMFESNGNVEPMQYNETLKNTPLFKEECEDNKKFKLACSKKTEYLLNHHPHILLLKLKEIAAALCTEAPSGFKKLMPKHAENMVKLEKILQKTSNLDTLEEIKKTVTSLKHYVTGAIDTLNAIIRILNRLDIVLSHAESESFILHKDLLAKDTFFALISEDGKENSEEILSRLDSFLEDAKNTPLPTPDEDEDDYDDISHIDNITVTSSYFFMLADFIKPKKEDVLAFIDKQISEKENYMSEIDIKLCKNYVLSELTYIEGKEDYLTLMEKAFQNCTTPAERLSLYIQTSTLENDVSDLYILKNDFE